MFQELCSGVYTYSVSTIYIYIIYIYIYYILYYRFIPFYTTFNRRYVFKWLVFHCHVGFWGVMLGRVSSFWNGPFSGDLKKNMRPKNRPPWKGKSSSKPPLLCSMFIFKGVYVIWRPCEVPSKSIYFDYWDFEWRKRFECHPKTSK